MEKGCIESRWRAATAGAFRREARGGGRGAQLDGFDGSAVLGTGVLAVLCFGAELRGGLARKVQASVRHVVVALGLNRRGKGKWLLAVLDSHPRSLQVECDARVHNLPHPANGVQRNLQFDVCLAWVPGPFASLARIHALPGNCGKWLDEAEKRNRWPNILHSIEEVSL